MWSQNCDDCSPEWLLLQVATATLINGRSTFPTLLWVVAEGPLLNDKGEVIGVNTLGVALGTGNVGINYAIGVDLVRQFVIDARQG